MKWSLCVLAAMVIGLGAIGWGRAQAPKDDYRQALIRTLGLTKVQRVTIKRLSPGDAQLASCLDRVATDARLEADLLPVIAQSVPTPDVARPVLAFLATSGGRKFAAAVARREPELKPALLRQVTLPGGVPMSAEELTTAEASEVGEFFRSAQGAPLLAILKETTGFAQLTRALAQRKTFAAECGLSVK